MIGTYHSTTYAALRSVLVEHGARVTVLGGLTELAGLLGGRHRLSPGAATRWMLGPNAKLDDRTPLDVWLDDEAGRVLDVARAATSARL